MDTAIEPGSDIFNSGTQMVLSRTDAMAERLLYLGTAVVNTFQRTLHNSQFCSRKEENLDSQH